MNKQEALEQLKWLRNKSQLRVDRDFTEPLDMAISALEKQIPKEVTEHQNNGFPFYKCTCCGNYDVYGMKYCSECGQAIDWSVEE